MSIYEAYLYLGQSFGKINLVSSDNKKTLHSKQLYFQQESLSQGLKKFWADNPIPQKILISSRFLERIFTSKLGGTVAQITTKGFENWLSLHQSYFNGTHYNQINQLELLGSQELVFGVSEKISSQGEIETPLDTSELEIIESKLKLMKVQRICIQLFNANLNSIHHDQIKNFFSSKGYTVFAELPKEKQQSSLGKDSNENSTNESLIDELSYWRKNLLDACLWGTVQDLKEEIKKSFEDKAEKPEISIEFLGTTESETQICETLFNWSYSLTQKKPKVLYLGLEKWSFINSLQIHKKWQSPWGMVAVQQPTIIDLTIQPSQEIQVDHWGNILPNSNELGFEPGPMIFGRSLRPILFDFLEYGNTSTFSYTTEAGQKRFQDHITTLFKNIPEYRGYNIERICREVQYFVIEKIKIEFSFFINQLPPFRPDERIILTGYFAPLFYAELRKFFPFVELDSQSQDCETMALLEK